MGIIYILISASMFSDYQDLIRLALPVLLEGVRSR